MDIKWILFKARPTPDEQLQLERAFKQSALLKAVVGLRNSFHVYFETAPDSGTLLTNLQTWMSEVKALGYGGFNAFLTTLTNWLEPIANFAHQRLTNAATEGYNAPQKLDR